MSKWTDADALRDRFQNLAYDDWNQGTTTTWANAFAEAADVVDDMPAADVAPVRRGWWEPYVEYLQWRCSECGFFIEVDLIDEITEKSFPNFCPNCGAQMEVAEK